MRSNKGLRSIYKVFFILFFLHFSQQLTADNQLNQSDPGFKGSVPFNKAVNNFIESKRDKILGGHLAKKDVYPWQVSLGVSWISNPHDAHFCGGSVYSNNWIVTAAHCVDKLFPTQVTITAGTNVLTAGAVKRNLKRIIIHKKYNSTTQDNDIALLELLNPLPINNSIKPIGLLEKASESKVLNSKSNLVVTGWGYTKENGDVVRRLRYLPNLPFIERSTCNSPFSYNGQITENMICAGFQAGGKDSCQGDSGGL